MSEVTENWAQTTDRIIYILKLTDDCFYIGQSSVDNYEERIKKHFRGKGSAWTKLHPPIEIVEINKVYGSYREIELQENSKTIEYMKRYGLKKVRGGFYSITDETQLKKNLLHHNVEI